MAGASIGNVWLNVLPSLDGFYKDLSRQTTKASRRAGDDSGDAFSDAFGRTGAKKSAMSNLGRRQKGQAVDAGRDAGKQGARAYSEQFDRVGDQLLGKFDLSGLAGLFDAAGLDGAATFLNAFSPALQSGLGRLQAGLSGSLGMIGGPVATAADGTVGDGGPDDGHEDELLHIAMLLRGQTSELEKANRVLDGILEEGSEETAERVAAAAGVATAQRMATALRNTKAQEQQRSDAERGAWETISDTATARSTERTADYTEKIARNSEQWGDRGGVAGPLLLSKMIGGGGGDRGGGRMLAGLSMGTAAVAIGSATAAAIAASVAGTLAGGALSAAVLSGVAKSSIARDDLNKALFAAMPQDLAVPLQAQAEIGFTGAYGDSYEGFTRLLLGAKNQLVGAGDFAEEEIRRVAELGSSIAATGVHGADAMGVIRGATQLLKAGVAKDINEALDLVTYGLNSPINAAGDFLQTLEEYPPTLAKAGISGKTFLKFLQGALEGGARDSDKAADFLKEAGIRLIEGRKETIQAVQSLGLDPQRLTRAINSGNQEAADAFWDDLIDRLREAAPSDRERILGELASAAGEDLGSAISSIDLSETELVGLDGLAEKVDAAVTSQFSTVTTGLKRQFQNVFSTAMSGVGDYILGTFDEEITGPIGTSWEGVQAAIETGDMTKIDAAVRRFLDNLIVGIDKWWDENGPEIREKMYEFSTMIGGWIGEKGPGLAKSVGRVFWDVGSNMVVGFLNGIADSISTKTIAALIASVVFAPIGTALAVLKGIGGGGGGGPSVTQTRLAEFDELAPNIKTKSFEVDKDANPEKGVVWDNTRNVWLDEQGRPLYREGAKPGSARGGPAQGATNLNALSGAIAPEGVLTIPVTADMKDLTDVVYATQQDTEGRYWRIPIDGDTGEVVADLDWLAKTAEGDTLEIPVGLDKATRNRFLTDLAVLRQQTGKPVNIPVNLTEGVVRLGQEITDILRGGGVMPSLPGMASGGPVSASEAYLVGERGPEVFVPSTNGFIVPNNALGAMGGGGASRSTVFDMHGSTIVASDPGEMYRELRGIEARQAMAGVG